MVEPEAQDDADETPAADPGQAPVDSNDEHFDVKRNVLRLYRSTSPYVRIRSTFQTPSRRDTR